MPEIQNPNLQQHGPGGGGGGGGDMRSMLGMMLVIVLVFVGLQYFKPKTAEPPAQTAQTQAAQNKAAQNPTAQSEAAQTQPQSPSPAANSAAPSSPVPPPHASNSSSKSAKTSEPAKQTPAIAAASESETTIENEQYKIVFTNRGAEVKHWILKHYYDTGGVAGGHHLDLVQPQAAARFGYPLSLYTYDDALTKQLGSALYQVTVSGSSSGAATYVAPASITFHYAGNGIDAVKTIRFDSSYVVTIESEVTRNGDPVRSLVSWPAGLGDMEEFLPPSAPAATTRAQVPISASSQILWSVDGKQTALTPTGGGFLAWTTAPVSNDATVDLPFQYAAISDLYFAAAFMPDRPESATLVTFHNSIDLPSNLSDPNSQKRPGHLLGLAMGDTSGITRLRLFVGPKAMDTLGAIHTTGADGRPASQSLKPLIQFGWWTIIAEPLYLALRFLYEHGIHSWGWAIILITVVFNLALLPQRLMMMKQSVKMRRLQPKVNLIKRKYANLKATDPKRAEMNTEMMALYKEEGVNMYGSCLPLLLQMPLFFAYYRVLANVIDLRQAHWFWLHDLSMPDPLYILPIFIIITMFFTQYITPSPGMDPAQRRMMAFMMPLIFGYSMIHFPSGLALYWGTGNIISLVMQLSINRSKMGQEMREDAKKNFPKKGKR